MKSILLLFSLLLPCCGCNLLEFPVYVIFGQSHTTVKAEYTGLQNQTVALIVSGQPAIDFDYPYARMDLALACAQAIGQHVKNVKFVDQEKIDQFQQAVFDWYVLPMSDIAARFEAQRLLYLELLQFTLVEIDSVNLLRGRISVQLRLYDMESDQPHTPSYESELAVVFPENAPLPMSDATRTALEQHTISLFADELARKFYKHKIPGK